MARSMPPRPRPSNPPWQLPEPFYPTSSPDCFMAKERPKRANGHPPSRGRAPGLDQIIAQARAVTNVTGCPVVGGVAVVLHGGGRHTSDIDIYSADRWRTHELLEAAGILWNADRREHVIGDLAVHMVEDDSLGGAPKRISTIEGVKVIGLADLIRGKLTVGLAEVRRHKDIVHVLDLIEAVPLDKAFAAKLPKHLRAPFKALVDEVHEPRRTSMPPRTFWKKYAT